MLYSSDIVWVCLFVFLLIPNNYNLYSIDSVVSLEIEPDLRPEFYSVVRPKKLSSLMSESLAQLSNKQHDKAAFHLIALSLRTSSEASSAGFPSETLQFGGEIDETTTSEPVEETLESRVFLAPDEYRIYRIYFNPNRIGPFEGEFSLTIFNSYDSSYHIKTLAMGDVPCLNMDPALVYRKVQRVCFATTIIIYHKH